MNIKDIVKSTIIHILIVILFILPGLSSNNQQSSSSEAQSEGDIKPFESEKQEVTPIDVEYSDRKIVAPHAGVPCKSNKSYGGVGIYTGYMNNDYYITYAVEGYPAAIAGLKAGDKIVYPKEYDIRGTIGTEVSMIIERNGQQMTFNLVRDKICVE